jgi:2-C-methyl-D-erythritol 4-phosphate cytidylyltransferase
LKEKEYALIVAGGKGTRFKSSVPKQFLELNGKPVLVHAVEAFFQYSDQINVVVVLPEEDHDTWRKMSGKLHFQKRLVIQSGGATRFQSVKKGLELIGEGFVAIHDGVRPLVSTEIIETSFRLARLHQSAVASVPLKESLRFTDGSFGNQNSPVISESKSVDRSRYRIIQTPQTFDSSLIKKAYALEEKSSLTDDASVAERAGYPIFLFDGSYENIKITTPEDLAIAEALMHLRSRL